jgi:hypothetical protein
MANFQTNYHRLLGLKQQEFILSQFGDQKFKMTFTESKLRHHRTRLSLQALGKNFFLASSSFRRLQHPLLVQPLLQAVSPLFHVQPVL